MKIPTYGLLSLSKPFEFSLSHSLSCFFLYSSSLYTKMEKPRSSKQVWDCGSALYDSFELNSFQKQLDSAIISSSRTLSMPRLPSDDLCRLPPPQKVAGSKKFSRSFQKLLRLVFRSSKPTYEGQSETEKPNGLSTIPEGEAGPSVRKTMSDRFSAASVGIHCA